MLIKSKDIAPDSQPAAWIAAEALGKRPIIIYSEVYHTTYIGFVHKTEQTEKFNHLSPEVVLEVMEWLKDGSSTDHISITMQTAEVGSYYDCNVIEYDEVLGAEKCTAVGMSNTSLAEAVISCLLMTRDEWEVPGELI